MEVFNKIKFNADGLVPVIAQDFETKEVLMMAWADLEALENTVKHAKPPISVVLVKSCGVKVKSPAIIRK